MRPRQWIKNTFVLAPLLFSGAFNQLAAVQNVLIAFILFCLAASATYVLNDYHDIENDKKHPVKSKRPLASGEVNKRQAQILLALLYGTVIGTAWFYPQLITVIAAYLLLNFAYTFYLKNQPILDIFAIASGFVLRVYAGAIVLTIPLSSWMFITTLSLAFYLAVIKRKQELISSGKSTRNVLHYYSADLLDKYAEIASTCAILFYSIFIISDKPEMVYTRDR